jgi:hypothetical protein
VGKPKGKRQFEDLGVDSRIIFKWLFKKWNGQLSIDLAHDRNKLEALVNAVMNLRFP